METASSAKVVPWQSLPLQVKTEVFAQLAKAALSSHLVPKTVNLDTTSLTQAKDLVLAVLKVSFVPTLATQLILLCAPCSVLLASTALLRPHQPITLKMTALLEPTVVSQVLDPQMTALSAHQVSIALVVEISPLAIVTLDTSAPRVRVQQPLPLTMSSVMLMVENAQLVTTV